MIRPNALRTRFESRMKTRSLSLFISAALFISAKSLGEAVYTLPSNIVQNGSFEEGWDSPIGWVTYGVSMELGMSGAPDGRNWASVLGTLYQDLPTEAGQLYHLSFAMAGNFNVSDLTIMNVLWGSTAVGTFTWNPAGHNINNMGWVYGDIDVVALTSTTRLTFENPFVRTPEAQRIIRLDAVKVAVVPEPAGLGLFLLGALGVLAVRRTRAARS